MRKVLLFVCVAVLAACSVQTAEAGRRCRGGRCGTFLRTVLPPYNGHACGPNGCVVGTAPVAPAAVIVTPAAPPLAPDAPLAPSVK